MAKSVLKNYIKAVKVEILSKMLTLLPFTGINEIVTNEHFILVHHGWLCDSVASCPS